MDNVDFVFAKVADKAGRYVRVEKPVDGITVKVSGEDHILKKALDGSWLLMSHAFLETKVINDETPAWTSENSFEENSFFNREFLGVAVGNLFAFIAAGFAIGGMLLWAHHWH
jgi:hypothetical protein